MTKSTINGTIQEISPLCTIRLGCGEIKMRNLPDISDSKSVNYNNDAVIGRSTPLYTYAYSGDRILNIQLHLLVVNPRDAEVNLSILRCIQSAAYPRDGGPGAPYAPPEIAEIRCGDLFAVRPVCAVLQNYSVKFPTEVAWDEDTLCPYKFDIDTQWLVVYTTETLPFNKTIEQLGY